MEKGRKALRYFFYLTLFAALVITVVYGSMAVYSINECHQDRSVNPFDTTDNTDLNKHVKDYHLNSFSALVAFAFALLLSVLSLHFRM